MDILSVIFAVLGISLVIAWHELGHYAIARFFDMRVLKYSIGFGPKLLAFTHKDIDYRISAIPFGGYVHIFGMTPFEEGAVEDPKAYINKPRWQRFLVLAAGPGFNYLMAVVFLFVSFWFWPGVGTKITDVTPNSAAAEAGLVAGDIVVTANGQELDHENKLREIIANSNGQPLSLQIKRSSADGTGTTEQTIIATPKNIDGAYRMGVALDFQMPRTSLWNTLSRSVELCFTSSVNTVAAFGKLIGGDKSVQMQGPVAMSQHVAKAVNRGLRDYLWIIAQISISLGIFNLLPVPSLDGIKMLILAVEGTFRRDIAPKGQMIVNAVGLLLILGLILITTASEVKNLILS